MIPTSLLQSRLKNLQQHLSNSPCDGLLTTNPTNITYLTGITDLSRTERDAILLVTPHQLFGVISPLRFHHFAHLTHGTFNPLTPEYNSLTLLTDNLSKNSTLGFESANLTVAELHHYQHHTQLHLVPFNNTIETFRRIKDRFEIASLTKACTISSQTWPVIQSLLKPGVTERQIAFHITQTQLKLGSQGNPVGFDPIVAFGPNSAIPHHHSSDRKLKTRDIALVDYGCTVNGYTSDLTRTYTIGQPSSLQKKIIHLVHQAYSVALAQVAPGITPAHIDKTARDFIDQAGYADQFIHSTGHGLGLSIHEAPSLASHDTNPLLANMVITIEPGIYIPNQFGVRYENTVLITASQPRVLT